jgi:thioredoxin 1
MAGTTVVMTHSQRQAFLKTSHLGQLLGVADLLPEVEEPAVIKYAPASEAKKARILSANEKTFSEKVLQSPIPVLVIFDAPQSRGGQIIHQMLLPDLLKLQASCGDKLKLVAVNANKNSNLSHAYRIKTLPTLFLIADGNVQEHFSLKIPSGKQNLHDFREVLEKIRRCINAG